MSTQKSQKIEDFLTSLVGISRQDAELYGICAWCKKPVLGFKDALSKKEYQISGFCQECQDKTFGG